MKVMTAKEAALDLVNRLPDDSSWEDIVYRIALRERVEESLKAADRGEVHTHEQVREMTSKWRKS